MSDFIERLYKLYQDHPVVVTDSRQITPGCLFFGLRGERFDGSEYADVALEQGAAFAIIRKGRVADRDRMIEVDDTLEVLQQLSLRHRNSLSVPVIGITGSNGKTTTKELILEVLATRFSVSSTKGNFNNHIGVPLTLLAIPNTTDIAIVEMGANHVGEIAMLCNLALPTHGLVTNIGEAHLEGFGGADGVRRAKGELYDSLSESGGTAFVNVNERFLLDMVSRVGSKVLYGSKQNAFGIVPDIAIEFEPDGVVTFHDTSGDRCEARTTMFGDHNLQNIASAIAVGLHFNVPGGDICEVITGYTPKNNRSEWATHGGNRWLLDAYNANPTSMTNTLRSFARLPDTGKVLILGAMKELGEYTRDAHDAVAREAAGIDVDRLIFVGEEFREAATSVGGEWYPDANTLITQFNTKPLRDACILIKGSRALHLESLLDAFK